MQTLFRRIGCIGSQTESFVIPICLSNSVASLDHCNREKIHACALTTGGAAQLHLGGSGAHLMTRQGQIENEQTSLTTAQCAESTSDTIGATETF
eukprot:7562143-Pyramimonas_sp.AAC.1